MSPGSPFTFGSSTVAVHIVRGLAGPVALYGGLRAINDGSWLWLALLPVAFVCLKGCPLCWAIGLIETVARVFRAQRRESTEVE